MNGLEAGAGPGPNIHGLPLLPTSCGKGVLSDSAGAARVYGALMDQELYARARASAICKKRRRINVVAAMLALILPWFMWVTQFSLVSFYIHYAAPVCTNLAAFCLLLIGVQVTVGACKSYQAGLENRHYQLYLGVALLFAALTGWVMGDINFWQYMQPSYHVDHLATYTNVDPSSQHMWTGEDVPVRGKRYQDAGKIYFSHNTIVDRRKSASFKDGDVYCVAPIVDLNCEKNCGYDFWAVGINCCGQEVADFKCGAYNSTRAKSGLREIVETWRPFFRLAVLQAEGTHGITSRHPLFFHWVEEPVKEQRAWQKAGFRRLMIGIVFSFFANALFLTIHLKAMRTW